MEGDGDNIKCANGLTGRNKLWLLKERTQAGGSVCVAAFDTGGSAPEGVVMVGRKRPGLPLVVLRPSTCIGRYIIVRTGLCKGVV